MENDTAAAPLTLTSEEARVLGCLIEKEYNTPEYYPLSLNQVVSACNQTTGRDPIVGYDERTVLEAVEGLKTKGLAFQITLAGARVQKFKHAIEAKFPRLERPTIALLCVLLLRGQQSAGELRQRVERMHAFADLPSTEAALQELISYPEQSLAVLLPPGFGRKTTTYAHLLGDPVEIAAKQMPVSFPAPDEIWKDRVEHELAELRGEVRRLRAIVEGNVQTNPEPDPSGSQYIP